MKNQKKINTDITLQTKTNVHDVIELSIDKIGAKKVVDTVRAICLRDGLERAIFPMSILATKDDEEEVEVGCALYYLKENFKECADKGMKLLSAKIETAQKVAQEKRCDNCQAQIDPNIDCSKCKNKSKWQSSIHKE